MHSNDQRFKELWRFIKFAFFSASAGLIETGLFYILSLIPAIGYWTCYLPALIASVVWNFTLNRRFTFQSNVDVPKAMMKVFIYYLIFTPLSTWLGNWLVEVRFTGYPMIKDLVFFATLLINFITEFLYQRYYVFSKSMDNRPVKKQDKTC
ncbi:hypothetical protein SDC9_66366 [bioreactor metagenome]|uniref:GtrA/DPMS transmembrane domain-containing protein n=1 Tax=bioreactor metagenome TaxID=1076179 RepID=A0A644XV30_9ZZZZ